MKICLARAQLFSSDWLISLSSLLSARGAKTHKRCWKRKKEDEEMFFGSVVALWSCLSCLRCRSCCSVCLSGSVSSCHCSGQKSAQTSIVLHTDLQLQAALPNIAALFHVCKIQCHLSAMIRGRHRFSYLCCLFVLLKDITTSNSSNLPYLVLSYLDSNHHCGKKICLSIATE